MKRTRAFEKYRKIGLTLVIGGISLPALAILTPQLAPSALSQPVVVVDVNVKEVARGYRASKLVGADVKNSTGKSIGSIDELIVDREKVLYVILQVGGFLGLGGFLVAVPYNSLEISQDGARIVLAQGSKEDLQKLPEFKYNQK
ncbi:MAG: PRC-barrel domain-containing protein [Hyphomicrobiales bacterium]|nr:PRC-barrel domain-containing protein [Hyphomicrobiales bacterium]